MKTPLDSFSQRAIGLFNDRVLLSKKAARKSKMTCLRFFVYAAVAAGLWIAAPALKTSFQPFLYIGAVAFVVGTALQVSTFFLDRNEFRKQAAHLARLGGPELEDLLDQANEVSARLQLPAGLAFAEMNEAIKVIVDQKLREMGHLFSLNAGLDPSKTNCCAEARDFRIIWDFIVACFESAPGLKPKIDFDPLWKSWTDIKSGRLPRPTIVPLPPGDPVPGSAA